MIAALRSESATFVRHDAESLSSHHSVYGILNSRPDLADPWESEVSVRDDEPGEQGRSRALDDGLHRIFAAALDLRAALRYVDDERAAAHTRAALDLLDQATRDLRRYALERGPATSEPDAGGTITRGVAADDET